MASSFNPEPTGRFLMIPGPRQQAAAATGFAAPSPAQPPVMTLGQPRRFITLAHPPIMTMGQPRPFLTFVAPSPARPPAPQSQGAPTPRMEMLPSAVVARAMRGLRPEDGQSSRASRSPPPLPKATLHFVASLPEFHFSAIRRRLLNQSDKKKLDLVRKHYNRVEGRAAAAERIKGDYSKKKGKKARPVGSSKAGGLQGGPVRRPHNGNPWIRA